MIIRDEVQKGAKLLDEKMPEWWTKISLEDLEMSSGHFCIVGQLFSEEYGDLCFGLGLSALAVEDRNSDRPGSLYGFNGPVGNSEWSALAEEWVAAIKDRYENAPLYAG